MQAVFCLLFLPFVRFPKVIVYVWLSCLAISESDRKLCVHALEHMGDFLCLGCVDGTLISRVPCECLGGSYKSVQL